MTPSSPYDPDSEVKPPDTGEQAAQNTGTMDLLMDMVEEPQWAEDLFDRITART